MRNWVIPGLLLLGAIPAFGQAPPFFGGGGTAFDPEVSTVFSGALMDAQAVVSNDRKYVTLNMRATNSRLRTLVTFPVVTADTVNRGFAGGANLGGTGCSVMCLAEFARAQVLLCGRQQQVASFDAVPTLAFDQALCSS